MKRNVRTLFKSFSFIYVLVRHRQKLLTLASKDMISAFTVAISTRDRDVERDIRRIRLIAMVTGTGGREEGSSSCHTKASLFGATRLRKTREK